MLNKSFVFSVMTISTLVVGINSLILKPSTALELSDGQKAFKSSPRLIRTAANFSNRNNSAARYQFTIEREAR